MGLKNQGMRVVMRRRRKRRRKVLVVLNWMKLSEVCGVESIDSPTCCLEELCMC